MKKTTTALISSLLVCTGCTSAQTNDDIYTYRIPTNAIRIGPGGTPFRHQTFCNYFLEGAPKTRENLIARDTYLFETNLIQRELFKDGKKYGVQREWYPNGQLKSEAPYRNGIMGGTFKHWDEAGRLVGQYQMIKGTGVVKIYGSNGVLIREKEYKQGKDEGLSMVLDPKDGIRSLVWYKDNMEVGKAYSFYPDDKLRGVTCCSPVSNPTLAESMIDGPSVDFNPDGSLSKVEWYIHRQKVSVSEYAEAAKKDPSLPPYYEDATQYTNLVTDEVKNLLKKYRNMPRVKIPLEFGKNGEPVAEP